jgi:uncharacterized protein (TIGR02118 family)
MTKISFLYPNSQGRRFDLEYYVEKHMPSSIDLLSVHPVFRGVSVEREVSAGAGREAPPYIAVCNYLFETFDDFLAAVTPHMALLRAHVSNYTDIEPVVQISEVVVSR